MTVKLGASVIDIETAHQLNVDTASRRTQFYVNVIDARFNHTIAFDAELMFPGFFGAGLPCQFTCRV